MTDFRNIQTQEDLETLFEQTNFNEDSTFSDKFSIDDPDVDEVGKFYQHVWIPECAMIGTLMSEDLENSGYDALFVQTLIQMFAQGKLIIKENN